MTREEAINVLENPDVSIGVAARIGQDPEYWKKLKPALDMAISSLRQQEQLDKVSQGFSQDKPLTLDELRKMSGEPVWVVTDRLKEWCIVHSHNSDDVIGGGIIVTRRTAEKRTYQYARYGKTWLAYRQKPEEGTV